jgi:hypothetical protein
VIILVEPSATETSARFVRNAVEPPSLVVDDGTSTVVFRPAGMVGGLADAAEFAQVLVQVASEWESGCRRALAAAQSGNPFDVDALVAEYDRTPAHTAAGADANGSMPRSGTRRHDGGAAQDYVAPGGVGAVQGDGLAWRDTP